MPDRKAVRFVHSVLEYSWQSAIILGSQQKERGEGTCCHVVCFIGKAVPQKSLKLYLLVTEHIWVGRAAPFVALYGGGKHIMPIFADEFDLNMSEE